MKLRSLSILQVVVLMIAGVVASPGSHAGARSELIACLQRISGGANEPAVNACIAAWQVKRAAAKKAAAERAASVDSDETAPSTPGVAPKSPNSPSQAGASEEKFNLNACLENKYTKGSPDKFVDACCAHFKVLKAHFVSSAVATIGMTEIQRKNDPHYCVRNLDKCLKSLCRD